MCAFVCRLLPFKNVEYTIGAAEALSFFLRLSPPVRVYACVCNMCVYVCAYACMCSMCVYVCAYVCVKCVCVLFVRF